MPAYQLTVPMPWPVTEFGATGLQNHGTGVPSSFVWNACAQYSQPLATSAMVATSATSRSRRRVDMVPSPDPCRPAPYRYGHAKSLTSSVA